MSGRWALALAVCGWVAVAVAGAVLVWGVISRAGDGVSGDLDALPSAARSAGSSDSSGTPDRSPPPSPSPSATSTARSSSPASRTWQGAAGAVSAECRGTAIRLTGATPSSGYAVEVDDSGPDRVRVEFETEESRTRVESVCVAGVPEFTDRSDAD